MRRVLKRPASLTRMPHLIKSLASANHVSRMAESHLCNRSKKQIIVTRTSHQTSLRIGLIGPFSSHSLACPDVFELFADGKELAELYFRAARFSDAAANNPFNAPLWGASAFDVL